MSVEVAPAQAAPAKPVQGRVKCVVWDLDNTVWDGVLLEDANVTLRPWVVAHIRKLDSMSSIRARSVLPQMTRVRAPSPVSCIRCITAISYMATSGIAPD